MDVTPTAGGDLPNPIRPTRSRITVDRRGIAVRPEDEGMSSRSHRRSCHRRSNDLPRQVRCDSRPDSGSDSGPIMTPRWDARATHGDGVCAVVSIGKATGGPWLDVAEVSPIREINLPAVDPKAARDLHVAEPSTMSANAIATDMSQSIPNRVPTDCPRCGTSDNRRQGSGPWWPRPWFSAWPTLPTSAT